MSQHAMVPMEVHLCRINPEQNMYRFYHVHVERDLFGTWCLIRQWGRLGTYGRARHQWFNSIYDALLAQERLVNAKIQHGYARA